MLRLLRPLLLLAVLIGLADSGVASAAMPCAMMTHASAATIADIPDCDMAIPCPDCPPTQGKGMKHGCAMMAGCVVALAIKEPAPAIDARGAKPAARFWPVAAILTGRIVAPEPEPPILLG